MSSPFEIMEGAEALLNEKDDDVDFPTQLATPTQDSGATPFPLAQSQGSVFPTQMSHSQGLIPCQQPPVPVQGRFPFNESQMSQMSQLSHSNAFASLEAMLATQHQAQIAQAAAMAPPRDAVPERQRKKTKQNSKKKGKKKVGKTKDDDSSLSSVVSEEGKKNKRGPNFTDSEWAALLDVIEDIAPIGKMKWQHVATRHVKNGYPKRTADNLKRRWNEKKKEAQAHPTGDADMPPLLVRVRAVARAIYTKIRAADLSEEAKVVITGTVHDKDGTTVVKEKNVPGEDNTSDLSESEMDSSSKVTAARASNIALDNMSNFSRKAKKKPVSTLDAVLAQMQAEADDRKAIVQLQKAQMVMDAEDRREQRKHDRAQKRRDHKFFRKLATIGLATFVKSQGGDAREIIDLLDDSDTSSAASSNGKPHVKDSSSAVKAKKQKRLTSETMQLEDSEEEDVHISV